MMPIGPLMIEHRLIEQVIAILPEEAKRMRARGTVDPVAIGTLVDFIRIYADRTHHGKEEDILFRDLAQKKISEEDHHLMKELIIEHVHARAITKELVEAQERSLAGNQAALAVAAEKMESLAKLYPDHIRKEDTVFFPASMKYFTQDERETMLREMWEFDREMIHEKYRAVVERLKETHSSPSV